MRQEQIANRFFQLLHQGTDVIPVDFIGVARPSHDLITQHDALFANLIAQAQALAFGRASHEQPIATSMEIGQAR